MPGEPLHELADRLGPRGDPGSLARVAQQPDKLADGRQRVGARGLDAAESGDQPPGVLTAGEPGGLGLDDDAGHVVSDDVVQFPGQFEALVASHRFQGLALQEVEVAEIQADGEPGGPDRGARRRPHGPVAEQAAGPGGLGGRDHGRARDADERRRQRRQRADRGSAEHDHADQPAA